MTASLSECKSSILDKMVSWLSYVYSGNVVFWCWDLFQFIDFLSFVAMTLATSDMQVLFNSTFDDLEDDLYSAVHQLEE